MKLKNQIVGLAVSAALFGGVAAVPSAVAVSASAAPASASVTVRSVTSATALPAAPAPAAATSAATSEQAGAVFKAVVAAIKRVPGLWTKTVTAVRSGWTAFKRFWDNSVPGWIKWILQGVTVFDLYEWLRGYIG